MAATATLGGSFLLRIAEAPAAVVASTYVIGGLAAAIVIRRRDGRVDPGLVISAVLLSAACLLPLLWAGPQGWVDDYLPKLGATVPTYTVVTAVTAPQGGRVAVVSASVIAAAALVGALI